MTLLKPFTIEIIGEGKTDIGATRPSESQADIPLSGVIPILVHRLCGQPKNMQVIRRKIADLQGGGLVNKVRFARQVAARNQSAGCVMVIDSEGDHQGQLAKVERGRKEARTNIPMAIGVAHPCIESWLLADGRVIQKALGLEKTPDLPNESEQLPAPRSNRDHNPKTVLVTHAQLSRNEIGAEQAWEVARSTKDLDDLRKRCPLSFAPFALEVETHIKPLFNPPDS